MTVAVPISFIYFILGFVFGIVCFILFVMIMANKQKQKQEKALENLKTSLEQLESLSSILNDDDKGKK